MTSSLIDLSYKKRDNKSLFANLEDKSFVDITSVQNYIPLYTRFFNVNGNNYNNINLNHRYFIKKIEQKINYNKYKGLIETEFAVAGAAAVAGAVAGAVAAVAGAGAVAGAVAGAGAAGATVSVKQNIFFKYSPLLDPIKYLIGKYESVPEKELLNLPTLDESKYTHPKILDVNNSAYVDSFFTYLTSKMLHNHGFLHGVDFYGSYLGIKHDYVCDIQDEIDCLYESSFFHKNNRVLYTIDNLEIEEIIKSIQHDGSRTNKQRVPLVISSKDDGSIIQLSESEITLFDNIVGVDTSINKDDILLIDTDLLYINSSSRSSSSCSSSSHSSSSHSSSSHSTSSCSSRSSHTDDDETGSEEDGTSNDGESNDGEHTDTSSAGGESTSSGDEVYVKINKFPVQVIALECCDNTLDDLMSHTDTQLTEDEWDSIVLQILMILITFQNTFGLTHNDLHTNNIMYNKTDEEYLYYKVDNKYYTVATYGRIFKIIDFGRAIYKFKGQLMCSDSFHSKEGDAATQYNCEPYYNDLKPRIEPNFSFDLCRLGCSMFDYIMDNNQNDDEEDNDEKEDLSIENIKSPIFQIIAEWCHDDKGRNILYKNNGDERYPDFKLYKMIARTVHNHVPINVLRNAYFDKFILPNKKLVKTKVKENKVMDIDAIPIYM